MNYSSIVIAGSMGYDTIMDFPKKFVDYFHPERLHQINISFVVSRFEKQLGGTATNIAYSVALVNKYLGNTIPVVPVSAIGKDGKDLLTFFKQNRISTKGILIDRSLYCASGNVITDIKDNQIWGYYYGATQQSNRIDLSHIIHRTCLSIISANHRNGFLHFQKQAIRNDSTYIYDPGMSLTWIKDKDLREGVRHATFLVGNDYEIAMVLKRLKTSVFELIHRGIKIIITLGEKGVEFHGKNLKLKVKSWRVKKIVDPTGAGDAWRGGFTAGFVSGLPMRDCLKLGNVMASFAVETYGTVNYRPTKKEIEKRLKNL